MSAPTDVTHHDRANGRHPPGKISFLLLLGSKGAAHLQRTFGTCAAVVTVWSCRRYAGGDQAVTPVLEPAASPMPPLKLWATLQPWERASPPQARGRDRWRARAHT